MRRLMFVTPAHGRPAMTAVCLEQRARVCDELADRGIDASCVVVAEDDTLGIADDLGMHTIRQPNQPFGEKWNAGFEWACREWQADIVVPIGTDDWVLADYVALAPEGFTVVSSAWLALVDPDGDRIAGLAHQHDQQFNTCGFIPWLIPAALIEPAGYRPVRARLNYGMDASLANAMLAARPRLRWQQTDVDQLQIIDFKSRREQITSYGLTTTVNPVAWTDDLPFERLATRYPADLVDRMQRVVYGRNP